ncbi:MAG: SLOG family protein, partial [Lactobacillaceae bacterium]
MAGKRLWVTGYRAYELNVFGSNDPKLKVLKTSLKNTLMQFLDEGLEWLIT